MTSVQSLACFLALCVLPYTIMATFEGILVAGRDSAYLARAYSLSGLLFLAYQVRTVFVLVLYYSAISFYLTIYK